MSFRYDIGMLKPAKRRADGSLVVDAYLTRTGIFTYQNADGTVRRELRLPEEVFNADAMDSFNMIPVTDDHPPENVTVDNSKRYQVGASGQDVRRDDDFVRATLMINDAAAIGKMNRGKVQISCGYSCDVEDKPGIWQGQNYDSIQRNIRGNHVAIVDVGRAGPAARVRMDACTMMEQDNELTADKDGRAKELEIDATTNFTKEYSSSRGDTTMTEEDTLLFKNTVEQLATETARADALAKELAEVKARADKFEGDAEGLKGVNELLKKNQTDSSQIDAFVSEIKDLKAKLVEVDQALKAAESPERFDAAVKTRIKIEAAASAVLGDPAMASLSDRDIMCAVVEKLHGVGIEADRSDDYVRARFDAAIEGYRNTAAAYARVSQIREVEAKREDRLSAREQMIQRNQNAWKTKEG